MFDVELDFENVDESRCRQQSRHVDLTPLVCSRAQGDPGPGLRVVPRPVPRDAYISLSLSYCNTVMLISLGLLVISNSIPLEVKSQGNTMNRLQ